MCARKCRRTRRIASPPETGLVVMVVAVVAGVAGVAVVVEMEEGILCSHQGQSGDIS